MKHLQVVVGLILLAVLSVSPAWSAGGRQLRAVLSGIEEVPAVASAGSADFSLTLSAGSLGYELSYRTEGHVHAAHIHLGQPGVNGGVIAFLCGGGGKPACPPSPATVRGTITATDIVGPAAQGIDPGDFQRALKAITSKVTYVNVHTDLFPSGELRGHLGGVGGVSRPIRSQIIEP
jgi:hypothetical protein